MESEKHVSQVYLKRDSSKNSYCGLPFVARVDLNLVRGHFSRLIIRPIEQLLCKHQTVCVVNIMCKQNG